MLHADEGFWLENVSRVKSLFDTSILPDSELIGKFYSRTSDTPGINATYSPSEPPCSSLTNEPGPSSSVLSHETDGGSDKTLLLSRSRIRRYGRV